MIEPAQTSPPDPAPPARTHILSDSSMDIGMARLLQVGVLLASGTVLLGGLLYLHIDEARTADYGTFTSQPETLRQPAPLLRALEHGDPAAVIQIGVLLLIATPIARVIFAAVAFALERDRLYVGISITVLTILLLGLLNLA